MRAPITKNTAIIGVLMRKIAAMPKFTSIMYRSTGNTLLPTQPSKYLYPSAYSFLLKINDSMLSMDRSVLRVYAMDCIPGTIKGEIALRLPVLENTLPALSA